MNKRNCITGQKQWLLALLLLSITWQHTIAQTKEFTIVYKNGKPYRVGKFIMGVCGKVLQETTYDANGNMVRQEEWQNGKECGITKVYKNKQLDKEIKFINGKIVSYIVYYKGNIYTKLSENQIIYRGLPVDIRWERIYQTIGDKIVVMTKNQLIEALHKILLPDDIVAVIAEISKDFASKQIPGSTGYLSCGGSNSAVKDAGIDITSSDPKEKKETADLSIDISNTCAANSRASLTSGFGNLSGAAASKGRIDRARRGIDKMIDNCGGSNLSSGGLFSIDLKTPPTAPPLIRPGTTVFNGAPLNPTPAPAPAPEPDPFDEKTEETKRPSNSGEPVERKEVKAKDALIMVAAVVGVGLLYLASTIPTGGLSLVAGTAVVVLAITPPPPPDGAGGGVSTPMPPGIGSENTCEKLKSFKAYCDNNGWKDMKCEDAARLFSGCGGDVREMYISNDGGIGGISCPSPLSPEEIARRACAAKGMIARPEPGGTVCRTKGLANKIIPRASDPDYTDPVREDLGMIFNKTSIKVMGSGQELSNTLKASKRPTMVVFMNPNCSSCQSFTQSLKSKEVNAAAANTDVLVIDASALPDVMTEYNITAYPSTLMVINGVKSTMNVGAMSAAQTVSLMNGK